jgi:hypothetical protein
MRFLKLMRTKPINREFRQLIILTQPISTLSLTYSESVF